MVLLHNLTWQFSQHTGALSLFLLPVCLVVVTEVLLCGDEVREMSVSWKRYRPAFKENLLWYKRIYKQIILLSYFRMMGAFSDFDLFRFFFFTANIAQLFFWVLHPTQHRCFGRVVTHLREVPAPLVTSVRGTHFSTYLWETTRQCWRVHCQFKVRHFWPMYFW